eukprot:scaffold175_cov177-Amphora_coffeaeformis.AAC.26
MNRINISKGTKRGIQPKWLTRHVLLTAVGAYLLGSAVVMIALHQSADQTLAESHPWKAGESKKNVLKLSSNQKPLSDEHKESPKESSGEIQAQIPQKDGMPKQNHPLPSVKQSAVVDGLEKTWKFNLQAAEKRLRTQGAASIRQPITAFVEATPYPPVLAVGNRGDMKNDKDPGEPPVYQTPFPLRTQTPNDLQKVTYPRVQTCHDMPQGFPIDQGLELNEKGKPIVWNVGDEPTPPDFPQQELPHCPVEADPYLPWIHDLFASPDGSVVHILAQNKRRCRTGRKFTENVQRLLPQVALMQALSVERLSETQARQLAPSLWQSESPTLPRYRLTTLEEASPDGQYTRFICRFHSIDFETGQPVVINETLSVYPFLYELAAYRKGHAILHTPKGKDNKFFWTSNLHFTCPVPGNLQSLLATGETVLSDGTPTLWLDVVPIRTPARYKELHLGTNLIGPHMEWREKARPWNVTRDVGTTHVLPAVPASGRWANLPLCPPQKPKDVIEEIKPPPPATKPHYLSACLWASAEFKTRGQSNGGISDTSKRLYEWLTFHFMVGFDHVYVYDNSGANTNTTNLEPILSSFGDKVTRIEWPSIVCNNNIPAHDSTGERSSQYAAENSCRTRYAPYVSCYPARFVGETYLNSPPNFIVLKQTEWIAAFDTDEYFVPMGSYDSLKDVLRDAHRGGTNILSFRSSRGRLRQEASQQDDKGRSQLRNATFLEAYNCDSAGSPKPSWADRARKQIYRADYVLYHFVHYSTVTLGYNKTYDQGQTYYRFGEKKPSERVVDEEKEAVLVHTKTVPRDMTNFYETRCRNDYEKKWQGCWVAYPWPNDRKQAKVENADGMDFNCFINRKVESVWVPKLRKSLEDSPFAGY